MIIAHLCPIAVFQTRGAGDALLGGDVAPGGHQVVHRAQSDGRLRARLLRSLERNQKFWKGEEREAQ